MPRAEQDIFRRVHVAIMTSTAISAYPGSYSKVCDTLRAADRTTVRTDLGRETFANFLVSSAIPNGLVRKLQTEGRPAGIKDGLSHAGFGESGGIYISHRDIVEFVGQARRFLMQEISASATDPGVDVSCLTLFSGTMGRSELLGEFGKMARVIYLLAIGQRGERFKPEVYAYCFDGSASNGIRYFHNDIQIPIALCILAEIGTIEDLAGWNWATFENFVGGSIESNSALHFINGAALRWNPSERFLAPILQVWALVLTPGFGILLANGCDSLRRNSEFLAAAEGKANQVESRRPLPIPLQGGLLRVVAEIPDEVDLTSHRVQQPKMVFDAVSVSQIHEAILS